MAFHGVIFDVDGVLVDSPHERAWRDTLEAMMNGEWRDVLPQSRYAPERFTTEVYQRLVAGKARESGARSALEHFGIPDAEARATLYGERKQAMLLRLVEAGELRAFPDALRFLLAVKGLGLPIAAASSSKNANLMLGKIRVDRFAEEQTLRYPFVRPGTTLLDLFDANLCGRDFPKGKPHPDIFLAAARALGVAPERALVVEDAPSGILAAKAGGMAALGVARLGDEALLQTAGADRVVASLDDVRLDALADGRLEQRAAA